MERPRSSFPLVVAVMATIFSVSDSRAISDGTMSPAHADSLEARRVAITGLVHYARAAIQRECSIDWLLFTDRAIESDYRLEREDSKIGQDHGGEDYAKVFREVDIDAGRMDCAKRILEVINRRKGVRFNAGLSIETDGELGFDPISSSIRAYSPRPTIDSI